MPAAVKRWSEEGGCVEYKSTNKKEPHKNKKLTFSRTLKKM